MVPPVLFTPLVAVFIAWMWVDFTCLEGLDKLTLAVPLSLGLAVGYYRSKEKEISGIVFHALIPVAVLLALWC